MSKAMKRILVIDDDRFVREGLGELLKNRGYFVDTAEDGYEAQQKVGENEYDLILLDLILPGLSGLETLKRLQIERPLANVVAMTAYSADEMMAKAIAEGAKKCFTKPININILENMLEEVVTAQH